MKNPFLDYIHNFRGLAIVLIVGVHCRTSLHWPPQSIVHDLLVVGLDSSTILFVFISGFLFQHLNASDFSYSNFLKKKIMYVVIPYALVSVPAIIDKLYFETDAYWMNEFYKGLHPIFQVMYMLLTGKHSGPFYFIPMISIIFLITPILYRLQKKTYFSLATIGIVLTGLFTYAYGYYGTIFESLLYFLPVYIFGMWVSKNKVLILDMTSNALTFLTAVYIGLFYLEVTHSVIVEHLHFFESTPHYFTSNFNWSKLKEMILAVILISVFYRLRNRDFKFLPLLGSFSFGIYFIHIYLINGTDHLLDYLQVSKLQNGIGYLIFVAAVILASTVTVFVVKKLFNDKSRVLIGS